jgi:hypothetical protein
MITGLGKYGPRGLILQVFGVTLKDKSIETGAAAATGQPAGWEELCHGRESSRFDALAPCEGTD